MKISLLHINFFHHSRQDRYTIIISVFAIAALTHDKSLSVLVETGLVIATFEGFKTVYYELNELCVYDCLHGVFAAISSLGNDHKNN